MRMWFGHVLHITSCCLWSAVSTLRGFATTALCAQGKRRPASQPARVRVVHWTLIHTITGLVQFMSHLLQFDIMSITSLGRKIYFDIDFSPIMPQPIEPIRMPTHASSPSSAVKPIGHNDCYTISSKHRRRHWHGAGDHLTSASERSELRMHNSWFHSNRSTFPETADVATTPLCSPSGRRRHGSGFAVPVMMALEGNAYTFGQLTLRSFLSALCAMPKTRIGRPASATDSGNAQMPFGSWNMHNSIYTNIRIQWNSEFVYPLVCCGTSTSTKMQFRDRRRVKCTKNHDMWSGCKELWMLISNDISVFVQFSVFAQVG